mgnify:CR=1 FL=1
MSTLQNEKLHRGVNPVVRKLSKISKISDKNALLLFAEQLRKVHSERKQEAVIDNE